ncbi:MAG: Rossmann-like and DUF2520 domain-containing protein [Candidatus Aminicenantales bacterium]
MRTAIIGGGRLGTTLGRALSRGKYAVRAVSDLNLRLASQSRRLIGTGRAMADNVQAAREADILFLCLPDDILEKEAASLARSAVDWKGKTIFHCSGLLGSVILRPLRQRGASIASFHPGQSFPRKGMPPSAFRGIFISLEGDPEACRLGRKIALRLGAGPVAIRAADKPLTHAACSMASNHSVVLFHLAAGLLKKTGLTGRQAEQFLWPLVEGTLHHVKKFGAEQALTGPVARGDAKTVARHLQALRPYPACRKVYRVLSREALPMSSRAGLPAEKIRTLNRLLRGR